MKNLKDNKRKITMKVAKNTKYTMLNKDVKLKVMNSII